MPPVNGRKLGVYAPLSSTYASDDALLEAGEKAELLYVRGLAFCAGRAESEGFISQSQLSIVGFGLTGVKARAAALVKHGVWDAVDGGYVVRQWLKWNKSADEMEKEKATDRVRKRLAKEAAEAAEQKEDSDRNPSGSDPEPGALSDRNPSGTSSESAHVPVGTLPDSGNFPEPRAQPRTQAATRARAPDALHCTALHSTAQHSTAQQGTPPAGASAAPDATDAGAVIGAWVTSRATNGQPKPAAAKRGAVGAEAKRLHDEGHPWPQLVEAATAMGTGPWDDLRKQVGILVADARPGGRTPSRLPAHEQANLGVLAAARAQLALAEHPSQPAITDYRTIDQEPA